MPVATTTVLSTLPNGAYTLRIVTHDQTYIRKVVKK
ncbi:MAG: T9SS type A sorting domain-containing protein [Bacteroidales bacterium]|nr:T9SS type A sorting domain-containing protein [Bacteroidales bacterium]